MISSERRCWNIIFDWCCLKAWTAGWTGEIRFLAGARDFFLSSAASRPTLEVTKLPIQRIAGTLSQGSKWWGCETDHSPPSRAEVKNGRAISPLSTRPHSVVLKLLRILFEGKVVWRISGPMGERERTVNNHIMLTFKIWGVGIA
jgi:hypothetical protein